VSASGNNGVSENLRPWKPGQSGNPSGRPKGDAWFRKLCRKRTVKALKALEAALERDEHAVSAAKALLEFGWGKAPNVVTLDGDDKRDTVDPQAALEALLAAKH
jgi:hypothetical protein